MDMITVAFDDIDNRVGGCTTHLTSLFLIELRKLHAELADYPLLVRLNPAIPWKTRGNASTAVRFRYDGDPRDIWELALWLVNEYAGSRPWMQGKKPGMVMAYGATWRDPGFRALYKKALTSIVTLDYTVNILDRYGARYYGGSGIIGAAAALGALGPSLDDFTFELLAYRSPDLWPEKRCVRDVPPSMAPSCVFNNYTPGSGFTGAPGGGDPVLVGIRGDCPDRLPEYMWSTVCESPDLAAVFRSNQHTDPHASVNPPVNIYNYGFYKAVITSQPMRLPGGHVIVGAEIQGKRVDLAFYREAGPLRDASLHLIPGDKVTVSGQVKPGPSRSPVISVDKMIVDNIADDVVYLSPRCPRCGSRMKSLGRAKGYRCPKCGYSGRSLEKVRVRRSRALMPGVYTPPEGRLPHLIAPSYRARRNMFELSYYVPWDRVLLTPR